jgi:hypothetical protein
MECSSVPPVPDQGSSRSYLFMYRPCHLHRVQAAHRTSETLSDIVLPPVGTLSVFDFSTGIPYPFGQESVGDMVSDFSGGVADAARSGATVLVAPFDDLVGKDAIVQFPGGVR